jgi:hypothetical protein
MRPASAPGAVRGGALGYRSSAYSSNAPAPSANASALGFLTRQSTAGGVNVRNPATTPRKNAAEAIVFLPYGPDLRRMRPVLTTSKAVLGTFLS